MVLGDPQAVLGLFAVGREADGDHQVIGTHAAHLLAIAAAQAGDQVNTLVGVLQVVDQVIGHRERTAHTDHVDVIGVDHQVDGFFKRHIIQLQPQALDTRQGRVDALAGQVAAAGFLRLVGDHAADALLVVLHRCGLVGVGLAKQRLHLTEPTEAETLGKPHDRRRVHFAFAGDVADAVDHDPVALLAHVAGDALELARQAFVLVGDQLQQAFGIDRRAGDGVFQGGLGIGAGHG